METSKWNVDFFHKVLEMMTFFLVIMTSLAILLAGAGLLHYLSSAGRLDLFVEAIGNVGLLVALSIISFFLCGALLFLVFLPALTNLVVLPTLGSGRDVIVRLPVFPSAIFWVMCIFMALLVDFFFSYQAIRWSLDLNLAALAVMFFILVVAQARWHRRMSRYLGPSTIWFFICFSVLSNASIPWMNIVGCSLAFLAILLTNQEMTDGSWNFEHLTGLLLVSMAPVFSLLPISFLLLWLHKNFQVENKLFFLGASLGMVLFFTWMNGCVAHVFRSKSKRNFPFGVVVALMVILTLSVPAFIPFALRAIRVGNYVMDAQTSAKSNTCEVVLVIGQNKHAHKGMCP